jgi:asparagine synthase (glutamine-hydrolysing)
LVHASGVKAILSGEGADECFLGYGPIAFEDIRRSYDRVLSILRGLVRRIPKLGKALWPHDSGWGPLVQGLTRNFEVELDQTRIQDRIREVGVEVRPREYRSLEWLGYHLRTLLHRNDTLGMAASIEARFPYLDHPVVQAAVNLRYKYKIRPSLAALDRAHPFLREKWVLRKVADRYIPRALSRRKKLGFPVNAYERMRVTPAIFKQGFVADLFQLSEPALHHLLDDPDRGFRVRLLMLEIWGRLFFAKETEAALVEELFRHTSIDPISA